MLAIYILTLLAFIFVSWLLWDRHYGTKRFIEKMEAQEKKKNSQKHVSVSKKKKSTKETDVVVGPATALAGAAMIHYLRNHNHNDKDMVTPSDDIIGLYDDDLADLYMMDAVETVDDYDEVQNDDDTAYDDYMASLDNDY